MRVLCTGAAGFIGSAVVRALIAGGQHEVIATARRGDAPSCRALDLDDRAAVDGLLDELRPEALIHPAWYARPHDYLRSRENLRSMAATLALCEAVLERGCRKIVGVGTCLEYRQGPSAHAEDDATDPVSLYASCKHATHVALRALVAQHPSVELSWARVYQLFGKDEYPNRIVPLVLAALENKQPIALSPGAQVRDFLHVADVGSAIAALLAPGVSGAVNICSGRARSLKDTLLEVAEVTGGAELLHFGERAYAPDEVMSLAGANGKLLATGWRPRYGSVAEAIRAMRAA